MKGAINCNFFRIKLYEPWEVMPLEIEVAQCSSKEILRSITTPYKQTTISLNKCNHSNINSFMFYTVGGSDKDPLRCMRCQIPVYCPVPILSNYGEFQPTEGP